MADLRVCADCSAKPLIALLRTSQHFSHVASKFQRCSTHVFERDSKPDKTSSERLWQKFWFQHPCQGPLLKGSLANENDAMIEQVQVLHTHCESAWLTSTAWTSLCCFHIYGCSTLMHFAPANPQDLPQGASCQGMVVDHLGSTKV